jgi:hypothetical protein
MFKPLSHHTSTGIWLAVAAELLDTGNVVLEYNVPLEEAFYTM